MNVSMEDENAKNAAENPYHKPQRFTELTAIFDKHLERFDDRRKEMNQKATWTLATATGFVALLGFLKDTPINETINSLLRGWLTNPVADGMVALALALFIAIYLVLVHWVARVYSPKEVKYPVSPIQSEDWLENEDQLAENSWIRSLELYVKPSRLEFSHRVLSEQIFAIINQQKLDVTSTKYLYRSFKLLQVLAFLTSIILLLK